MENKINVLDHGYVKLISCSGDDIDITKSARISYNKLDIYDEIEKRKFSATRRPSRKWEDKIDTYEEQIKKDHKLIWSLMKRKHTSPFEQIQLRFEVKAPIFIFRQWHRHRTWAYNEVSARYTELADEFYQPSQTVIGKQLVHEKQKRDNLTFNEHADLIRQAMKDSNNISYMKYKHLLSLECPRELARCVLPVSIYSAMVASVSLHNWFRFIKLRMDSHAQWEIQEYARAMWQLVAKEMPISCEAFKTIHGELFNNEKE